MITSNAVHVKCQGQKVPNATTNDMYQPTRRNNMKVRKAICFLAVKYFPYY